MRIKQSMIICLGIALVLMTIGTATAGTFTVNNSTGPVGDYTSIQAAVDAVTTTDGDTIIVYPGIYTENVYVYKELIIKSQSGNPDDTIVQAASSSDYVFHVNKDNVTISGLTATGAYSGIYLDVIENCIVINNKMSNNDYAIYIHSSNNTTLTNNTASNNKYGITLSRSGNSTLMSNTASNNNGGITLSFSNNNMLISNTASGNADNGITLFRSSNNNLTSNTASDNSIGIYLSLSSNNNLTSNTASNNSNSGIRLHYSNNNLIYNNRFNNTANTGFSGTNTGNVWNTTKIAGTNIIGAPYLGGNYWSDYDGVDTDCGSIGDMPYEMDVDNTDYLPLCLVTYNPYDENEDYVIDIGEVSAAIDDYRTQGPISIAELSELIDMYRSGEPYC